ncbi:MAG: HAD family hydrolase [Zestosphaera sp.]
MIKLVIFDVWNTLLSLDDMHELLALRLHSVVRDRAPDTLLDVVKAVHSEVKSLRIGNEASPSEVLSESRKRLCDRLGITLRDFQRIHDDLLSEASRGELEHLVIDGAREVLSFVKELNLKTAVLGNVLLWDSTLTETILNTSGLGNFIDRYFFSDRLGHQKPEFEAFMNVVRHFGLRAGEAVHVGDNVREDFGGALVAGLKAVLISGKQDCCMIKSEEFAIIPEIKLLIPVINEWFRTR